MIKPLFDRVVIKQQKIEEKTVGGLIIIEENEGAKYGQVIAIGKGKKDEPTTVMPGDKIIFGNYAGTEIKIEGEKYLIMRESDILAII